MSGETPSGSTRPVRQLDDALVDQIAAGEVVERPASVVKELAENALDAGASRLRVEVRSGGRDFIAVTDDGCGMSPEDARLALRRHATSKITRADDLQRIATYGFRGEALPAIASVSTLRLRTRPAGAAEAFELRVEQGRLVDARAAGGPVGTKVEVADLFAGVPARRMFLKTVATEWGHVSDWLSRAALALPGVHVEIRRDDRPALVWPAARTLADRVAAVLGEEEAGALVACERAAGPAVVHGLVSRPDRHRPNLTGVYLFVNGRPVRDRLLQHALVDVYRDVLPRGRFPSGVLFVDVPPESVDVNVHPAKWEVRFSEPQAIHRLVRHSVREALAERSWIVAGGDATPATWPERATPSGDIGAAGSGATRWAGRDAAAGPGQPAGRGDWIFADGPTPPASPTEASLPGLAAPSSAPDAGGRVRFGDLRLLGQLLATYLVLEGKEGLVLVDQHAAHERVLYERLRAEWSRGQVERQGLLVPATVVLAPAARRALEAASSAVSDLGFDVEPFGDDAVAVRAVPALLAGRDPVLLVRELADELAASPVPEDGLAPGSRALEAADRLFASLACHSARRKGDAIEPKEQQALLDALDAIPWAPTCPHGRPVAVPLDLFEIERRFSRR